MGLGDVIVISIVAGMGAGVLGMIEALATRRFSPLLFRRGPRVLNTELPLPRPVVGTVPRETHTSSAVVRLVRSDECFFQERWDRPILRLYTPFALKGRIHWEGPRAIVEGRLGIAPLLFVLCATIAFGAIALLDSGVVPASVLVFLLPAACWWGIRTEIRRAKETVEEVASALARQAV